MNNLDDIKENIRTINPHFSDQLIDLLYEYIAQRFANELKNKINK